MRHQCRASTHTNSCVRNCVTLADPRGSGGHARRQTSDDIFCFANKTHFRTNWPTPQVVITQKGLRLQLQGLPSLTRGFALDPIGALPSDPRYRFPICAHDMAPHHTGVARILLQGGGTGAWRTGSEVRGDKGHPEVKAIWR